MSSSLLILSAAYAAFVASLAMQARLWLRLTVRLVLRLVLRLVRALVPEVMCYVRVRSSIYSFAAPPSSHFSPDSDRSYSPSLQEALRHSNVSLSFRHGVENAGQRVSSSEAGDH